MPRKPQPDLPKPKIVPRTPEQKREMVQAFINRGDKSTREAARELGVSPQLLYSWQKLLEEGKPLMGEESELEARLLRAKEHAKHTIIAHVEQPKTADTREEISFHGASQSPLLELAVLRSENTSLRAENDRLKKALKALTALLSDA